MRGIRGAGPLRVVLFMALGAGAALAVAAPPPAWRGTVTHVTDGDTLWVRPRSGGAPQAVRLTGIDAPELCQRHGEAARAALVGRVLGQQVQVRGDQRDDYGRKLARVSLGQEDVGAWLVRQGHAWSYRYRGQSGPYARQEALARAQGRGLFGAGKAERPRDFRRRHGPCH